MGLNTKLYNLLNIIFHCLLYNKFFIQSFTFISIPRQSYLKITSRNFNLCAKRRIYEPDEIHLSKVLIVESGFGCDQHGQNSTKAAVRACRNAIEFNSLPGLRDVIPGGKENMIVKVQVAVPNPEGVDIQAIAEIFPYGKLVRPEILLGGMSASSGIELPELGDKNDQMIFAIAVVSVGY